VNHLDLVLTGGQRQLDLEQEPVELGLGQGIGALVLDRVLGGGNHEGRRQGPGHAVDRDLALLHGLQECSLGLGRRPVDLVGKQQVGEHRSLTEGELGAVRVVDQRSGDVAGHEVGRELHPLGPDVQRGSNRADEQGLGHTGHALEQDVAPAQQRDEDAGHRGVLPDDCLGDLMADRDQRVAGLVGGGAGLCALVDVGHVRRTSFSSAARVLARSRRDESSYTAVELNSVSTSL